MSIKIREKKLKNGERSLYLDIYQNGKRSYEFLKELPRLTGDKQADRETRQLAENIKAKRQLQIGNHAHGFTPSFNQKANFADYLRKVAESFDTSTGKQYKNVLKKVIEYDGNHIPFGSINKKWVEKFKDHLLETVGENTARTYLAMLKAALNRAVSDEKIPESPGKKVKGLSKQKKLIGYLEKEELKTLQNTPLKPNDVKLAFLFSCYTGLRFSDVEALTWGQIRGSKLLFTQKKTQGAEYLPLNKQALGILNQMDTNSDKIFDLPTNAYCNRLLKDWVAEAGLDRWVRIVDEQTGEIIQRGLTYHVSRHTFAVMLLNNGVDLYSLKELMGHTSIDSTEVYAEIVGKTKEKAINKFPEL